MANFAKAQLMKYGWTEGKGLGKHENGITQALKPKLKFDTAGVGHKDSNWNEWWETTFNNAANNIKVKSISDETLISVRKKDNVKSQIKEKSKSTYGNFLKTSTLYGNDLVEENDYIEMEQDKLEKKDITHAIPLTDEELFKACGGRTAHKGARHGLRLTGKLQRINEQEKKLLNIYKDNFCNTEKKDKESESGKLKINDTAVTALPSICPLDKSNNSDTSIESSMNKLTKKEQIQPVDKLTHNLNALCDERGMEEEAKSDKWVNDKKLLKRKRRKEKGQEDNGISDISMKNKIERKRSKREAKDSGRRELDCPTTCSSKKRKSKRRKTNDCQSNDTIAMEMDDQEETQCNQFTSKKANKSSKHKSNKFLSDTRTEAEKLNRRIEKKKRARFHRRQESRFHNLTESIRAISFDAEQSSVNMAKNNVKNMKKLSKKVKKERKILKLRNATAEVENMFED